MKTRKQPEGSTTHELAENPVPKGLRLHVPKAPDEAFVFEAHAREHLKITATVPEDEREREEPGGMHATYTIEGSCIFPPASIHNARVKMAEPSLRKPTRALTHHGFSVPCVEYRCDFSGDTFYLPAGAAPLCIKVDFGDFAQDAPNEHPETREYVVHPALGALGEEAMREALAEYLACALQERMHEIWFLLERASILEMPWERAWPQPYARHETCDEEVGAEWTLGKTHRDTGKPFFEE